MTTAKFYAKGGSLGLRMSGHSASAPKGEDLVCAGASTLAMTLAANVSMMNAHGKLAKEPKIILRSGYALVRAKPKEEYRGELMLLYSMIQVGMYQLKHNYPEYFNYIPFETADVQAFSE